MCGIVGFVGKQGNKEQVLDDMMKVIVHRGAGFRRKICE